MFYVVLHSSTIMQTTKTWRLSWEKTIKGSWQNLLHCSARKFVLSCITLVAKMSFIPPYPTFTPSAQSTSCLPWHSQEVKKIKSTGQSLFVHRPNCIWYDMISIWYLFTAIGFHPVAVVGKLAKNRKDAAIYKMWNSTQNNKKNAEYTR
jgi:hypothetical protein